MESGGATKSNDVPEDNPGEQPRDSVSKRSFTGSRFGEKLRAHMRQSGMTLEDLSQSLNAAGVADVSVSSVSRWCAGKQFPRVDAALEIARVFGVSVEYLTD